MRRVSKKRKEQRETPEGSAYANILYETSRPWCWACGVDPPLERAHLAAGSGTMLRVENRKGIVLLCSPCHRLHRHTKPEQCICDPLTDANVLWLKRERDPDYWDPLFVRNVWIGAPPDPEEPTWLRDLYLRRRG